MRSLVPLVLLAACGPDAPTLLSADPAPAVERFDGPGDGATAAWLPDGRSLLIDGDAVILDDPRAEGPRPLGVRAGAVTGAAVLDDTLLIATDTGLTAWSGEPWPSPLADALDGPPTALRQAPDGAVWLDDGTGWRILRDGALERVRVDGAATSGDLALGGRLDGVDVAWLAVDGAAPAVLALDAEGTRRAVHALPEARAVAVDASGTVWAADGIALHRRDPGGLWTAWTFDAGVAEVAAHPASPRVWVRTADGALFGDRDGLAPVDLPDGRWLDVDAHGRLWIATDAGVAILAVDRPVALLDLPAAPLTDTATLTVDPTGPEAVTEVVLTVDGTPVDDPDLDARPWRWSAAATRLLQGTREVQVTVTWDDGVSRTTSAPLEVAGGRVTWDDHVRVLNEDHCLPCHGGANETLLEDREAWETHYDRIVTLVVRGEMPLGRDPLPDDDVDRLIAWGEAGFP